MVLVWEIDIQIRFLWIDVFIQGHSYFIFIKFSYRYNHEWPINTHKICAAEIDTENRQHSHDFGETHTGIMLA